MSLHQINYHSGDALNYLHQSIKNPEIRANYGKYFGYADFKAQVLSYKNEYFENVEVQTAETLERFKIFKETLADQICEKYLGEIKAQDELSIKHQRVERFYALKVLAVKAIVLDKTNGILNLITRNQRKGGDGNRFIQHSYLQVRITQEPSISDWRRIHHELITPNRECQGYIIQDLVVDGSKFSIVRGEFESKKPDGTSVVVKIHFLWENHRREIIKENRHCYFDWNCDSNSFKDRKYLHIDNGGSIKFIKSHGEEVLPLLSDKLCEDWQLPFNNSTSITPNLEILSNMDIQKIFNERILKIKSARLSFISE